MLFLWVAVFLNPDSGLSRCTVDGQQTAWSAYLAVVVHCKRQCAIGSPAFLSHCVFAIRKCYSCGLVSLNPASGQGGQTAGDGLVITDCSLQNATCNWTPAVFPSAQFAILQTCGLTRGVRFQNPDRGASTRESSTTVCELAHRPAERI